MTGAPSDPYLELADAAAHEAARRSRAEERDRLRRASEVATWLGTLRDLAERGVEVVVQTRAGRRHRGALVGLAADHVMLRTPAGALALLRLSAIRTVRTDPERPAPAATGDRGAASDRQLIDVLDRRREEGEPVVVVVRDLPEPLRGVPVGLGEDVLSLRPAGERQLVYLAIENVDEVLLDP